jgi:glycerol-3-phosphate cytidylyltransferase
MLKCLRAKLHCDYLIVGLQTGPTLDRQKNRQSVVERYIQLKGCSS